MNLFEKIKKVLLPFLVVICFLFNSKGTNAQHADHSNNETQKVNELKVLSWNIFMLPPFIYITGKRKRAKVLGDYFAQSDYDVLVLQETFHPGARRKIKCRSKKEYPYRIGPVNRRILSIRTNSGVSIYSKLPLVRLKTCKFKEKATTDDKLARKGALMVEVEKNEQKFQIVGTHLNAGGPIRVRHAQVDQIKDDLLTPFYTENIPQIIAGDMNMKRQSDNLRYMEEAFNASDGNVAIDPYTDMDDCPFYDLDFVENPIDFIFFRTDERQKYNLFRYSPCIAGEWKMKCKKCWKGEEQNGYEKDPNGVHYWLSDHPPIAIEIKW